MNVNKYLPVYAPGKKPQFIEGTSFKMIIPLDEKMIAKFTVSDGTVSDRVNDRVSKGVTEGIIGGISASVKSKLLRLVLAVMNKPLQKAEELATGLTQIIHKVSGLGQIWAIRLSKSAGFEVRIAG